jgi:hypothetical protein
VRASSALPVARERDAAHGNADRLGRGGATIARARKTSYEIAARLGKAVSAVLEVLCGTRRPPPAFLGAGRSLVEPHKPRVPRVTLDQAVLQAAAMAFAKGEIDRAELLRRITR